MDIDNDEPKSIDPNRESFEARIETKAEQSGEFLKAYRTLEAELKEIEEEINSMKSENFQPTGPDDLNEKCNEITDKISKKVKKFKEKGGPDSYVTDTVLPLTQQLSTKKESIKKYININAMIEKIDKAVNENLDVDKEESDELSPLEKRIIEVEKIGKLDPNSKIDAEIEVIKEEIKSITSDNYDKLRPTFYLNKKYKEIRDIIFKKVAEFKKNGGDYNDDVRDNIYKLKEQLGKKYRLIEKNIYAALRRTYDVNYGGKKSRKFKRKTKKGKRSRKARKSRRKSNRRRGRR